MAEYQREFAEKLAEIAGQVADDDPVGFYAAQAVIYLSLLSIEITLKALLEQAGKPVGPIKNRGHDLKSLLEDLGEYEVKVEGLPSHVKPDSGARLRAVVVDPHYQDATVGTIIEGTAGRVSQYPNEIRYGNSLRHYSPTLLVKTASAVSEWAKEHWDTISYSRAERV